MKQFFPVIPRPDQESEKRSVTMVLYRNFYEVLNFCNSKYTIVWVGET